MTKIKNQNLKKIISSFKTKKVAVVGDLILDEYVWGNASRISQEAPVPVMHVTRKTSRLGGAANVMCNIVSLGAKSSAFGITGNDLQAEEIQKLMKEQEIDSSSVLKEAGRKTTVKQRVIAASQQLVRIDYEDVHNADARLKSKIVDNLKEAIAAKNIDAVIFEDYAKGLLDSDMAREIQNTAKSEGIMIGLDPHPGHPLEISGITVMTPNKSEALGMAEIYHPDPENEQQEIEKAAIIIKEKWNPDYLLITLGAQGMALFEKNSGPFIIPTRAREVFDVSGAGDTVIAAFTLALLSGANGLEASEIANHAAGVVVGKVGTVPVSREELLSSF
jgi:rfaE bifunctional protein kinase chain/domain